MNKLYDRIDFINNTTPALNETNLNLMSKAIDDIDDRVVAIGGDVLEVIPQIQAYLEQADDLVEALELMTANPPYIGANGHWYVWDTETGAYVDSNIDASITVDIADITMLSPDATPYVTNTGTDTDPIFHLFIPRGQTGAAGHDGQDGVSPTVTISTITGGHRITITDKDHPNGQSFDVMDGASGGVTSFNDRTGIVTPQSGDYTALDVGAVASSGGEAGDTIVTFTDPSADGNITSGSTLKTIIGLIKYKLSHITGGGHTIINSSGISMTQRAGLQFEGMGVTDDSTNDKTVVTLPTPDYVDEQFNPSTTYSLGMTCIEGNVRYRYKNSTATSGHRPPDTTYWEVYSVASELGEIKEVKYEHTVTANTTADLEIDLTYLGLIQNTITDAWIDHIMSVHATLGGLYNETSVRSGLSDNTDIRWFVYRGSANQSYHWFLRLYYGSNTYIATSRSKMTFYIKYR